MRENQTRPLLIALFRRIVKPGGFALLLLGAGSILFFKNHPASSDTAKPVAVISAPVSVPLMTVSASYKYQTLDATGSVKSDRTADIASKIMGRISAITVKEGDPVRAGQILVRLESADLQAQVAQAEAAISAARQGVSQAATGLTIQRTQSDTRVEQAKSALQQAQAQLSLVREGARSQQKAQADAALRQADYSLKSAQSTYMRYSSLYAQGAISRQRLDDVALQRDLAQGNYDSAKEQSSLVYEGSRSQEILQAEEQVRQASEALRMARASTGENRIKADNVAMLKAQVEQAQANLTAARVALSYSVIQAPFDGVIIRRNADPGAMASPGVPLLSLDDTSGYRFEAILPESQLKTVHVGAPATIRIDALNRDLRGTITRIVPNADLASRSFVVKVALSRDSNLKSGLFGRLLLRSGERKGVYIPNAAVWNQGGLTSAYVIEGGAAHQRIITTGETANGETEILSGLSAGERIVRDGLDRIYDGAKIISSDESASAPKLGSRGGVS